MKRQSLLGSLVSKHVKFEKSESKNGIFAHHLIREIKPLHPSQLCYTFVKYAAAVADEAFQAIVFEVVM
jgi:hypothetical protein